MNGPATHHHPYPHYIHAVPQQKNGGFLDQNLSMKVVVTVMLVVAGAGYSVGYLFKEKEASQIDFTRTQTDEIKSLIRETAKEQRTVDGAQDKRHAEIQQLSVTNNERLNRHDIDLQSIKRSRYTPFHATLFASELGALNSHIGLRVPNPMSLSDILGESTWEPKVTKGKK